MRACPGPCGAQFDPAASMAAGSNHNEIMESGLEVGEGWVRNGLGRAGGFTSNALRRTTLANP